MALAREWADSSYIKMFTAWMPGACDWARVHMTRGPGPPPDTLEPKAALAWSILASLSPLRAVAGLLPAEAIAAVGLERAKKLAAELATRALEQYGRALAAR